MKLSQRWHRQFLSEQARPETLSPHGGEVTRGNSVDTITTPGVSALTPQQSTRRQPGIQIYPTEFSPVISQPGWSADNYSAVRTISSPLVRTFQLSLRGDEGIFSVHMFTARRGRLSNVDFQNIELFFLKKGVSVELFRDIFIHREQYVQQLQDLLGRDYIPSVNISYRMPIPLKDIPQHLLITVDYTGGRHTAFVSCLVIFFKVREFTLETVLDLTTTRCRRYLPAQRKLSNSFFWREDDFKFETPPGFSPFDRLPESYFFV